jgi:adenine/guanine phosphoribosyltransferase-like PRPP-binding protein
MSLFIDTAFTSHAGLRLAFKIECDALTDEDIETLASIVARSHKFTTVIGIPRGGIRLARALRKHRSKEGCILIVDDVLTSGMSMEAVRGKLDCAGVQGVVIFARGRCPAWIKPIFQLADWAGP